MWLKLSVIAIILAFSVSLNARADVLPSVVGSNINNATNVVAELGLDLIVDEVQSERPIGEVLFQIPNGGTDISGQSNVYVRVSGGVTLPTLLSATLEEAIEELDRLKVGYEYVYDRALGVDVGLVAKQVPDGGVLIDASAQIVYLRVSNDKGVKIPDLRGLTHIEAKERLAKIGLVGEETPLNPKLYESTHICTADHVYKAEITATVPSIGAFVPSGATVSLSYNRVYVRSIPGVPCTVEGVPL